jgi:hypothetical protein
MSLNSIQQNNKNNLNVVVRWTKYWMDYTVLPSSLRDSLEQIYCILLTYVPSASNTDTRCTVCPHSLTNRYTYVPPISHRDMNYSNARSLSHSFRRRMPNSLYLWNNSIQFNRLFIRFSILDTYMFKSGIAAYTGTYFNRPLNHLVYSRLRPLKQTGDLRLSLRQTHTWGSAPLRHTQKWGLCPLRHTQTW